MRYDGLVAELVKRFDDVPQIQKAYNDLIEWTEPSPHVVFGDVLEEAFLLSELATMQDRELLGRIFRFLEEMAESGDQDVRDVLTDTVLERLGDDREILVKARALMGPRTLELSHKIERFWGRE